MPVPLLNLDDRTFSDLAAETRALIPRYAPEWTNHNESDPGITLLELFAWLAEILIFRLNRIPEASEGRFLQLLGAAFSPAQPAIVRLNVAASNLGGEAIIVPRGAPFLAATPGRSAVILFETVHDLQLTPGSPQGVVEARQTSLIQNERLGASAGKAHQVFPLPRGKFIALDEILSATPPAPLRVIVGNEEWAYQPTLLYSTGQDKHFTVEPSLNIIRFGDGSRGQIPQAGEEIIITYYYTLGRAGNAAPTMVFDLDRQSSSLPQEVREAIAAGVSFAISNEGVSASGADPTSLDEARDQAISALKTRWRAITAGDFEELALGAGFNLARAKCLPELDLTSASPSPYEVSPGHVSIIVVPNTDVEMPGPDQQTIDNVWALLDQRRLITCRHHVVGPGYTDLRVEARVVRDAQVQEERLALQLQDNLRAFFHPLTGGPGPNPPGWPFGRDVYASEVYQVIEGTLGVDHVESLTLYTRDEGDNWTDAGGSVAIPPNNLPHFMAEAGNIRMLVER